MGSWPATSAQLSGHSHLALSPGGATLYIADTDSSAVRALTLATGILTALVGNGSYSWTPDGTQATQGAFTRSLGLAVDFQGIVYFSESGYGMLDVNGGNNCVRAVDPSGAVRSAVGRCEVSPHSYVEGS